MTGAGSECIADVYVCVLHVCSHLSSMGIVCATVAT